MRKEEKRGNKERWKGKKNGRRWKGEQEEELRNGK